MNPDVQTSILVVDDVPANLQLLSSILKNGGYRVRPAISGPLALEAARHSPPDLILLDISMPEMNGFEVCRRLKADPKLADIPVIFISALTEAEDKVRAFAEGGLDYVTKPFQMEEVLARVRTHLALRAAGKELERRNAELEEAMDRLRTTQGQLIVSEKMAALGVLAAGVAHEINNPVNFVQTSCHGLQKDVEDLAALVAAYRQVLNENQQRCLADLERRLDYETLRAEIPQLLDHVFDGLRRAESIVRSLLSFARTDEDMEPDLDLRDVVDSVLVVLRNRFKDRAKVEVQDARPPSVRGNRGKLSQVVLNLLTNALDAVEGRPDPERRRVLVSFGDEVREGAAYAVLRVADTGPGIPSELRTRIFDPFFTTKPVGRGTGLGLFICNNLIEEHGGIMEVESAEGQGATFSVYLPVSGASGDES